MNSTDQLKVIAKGFMIIRVDREGLRIKAKLPGQYEWITHEKGFKSYAALLRRMKELLKTDNIIED